MIFELSPLSIEFPSPELALKEPNGLLAVGGDLSVSRLFNAYQHGIFPWFSEQDPILWWSPDPRAVFWPDNFHISRSLKKFLRKANYQATINIDFQGVILACQQIHERKTGTWITEDMFGAYLALHKAGHAHSIEVWQNDQLVGGLYGVMVGNIFCGESMFHCQSHASKFALISLIAHLKPYGLQLVDCQMPTSHLISLGAEILARDLYLSALQQGKVHDLPAQCFQAQSIMCSKLAF